jgi:hypothetical protein
MHIQLLSLIHLKADIYSSHHHWPMHLQEHIAAVKGLAPVHGGSWK